MLHRDFPSRGYLVAVAAVLVATMARGVLEEVLAGQRPFITYFAAVAVAAWYGGVGPGIAAIFMSFLLAELLFIPPRMSINLLSLDASAWADFLAFTTTNAIIVGISEFMHRANSRASQEARAAEAQENLLKVTLTSIGDGVITTDTEGRVTLMNPAAEALTGWSLAEARGQPLLQVFRIVNEQTRLPVENPCARVLRTGAVVGLANHTVLIARDGSERPIDDTAAPIVKDGGTLIGVVLVFQDATEQRRTVEALQRLATIVEQSEDAIVGKDINGIITHWNAGAERLFGYPAGEIVGKHISLIVPSDRVEEHAAVMQRLKQGERVEHWDTVRRRKDGSLIDVSLQISPIRNHDGAYIGASKIARDITEKKRDAAALALLARISTTLAALVDRDSALQQAAGALVPEFADYCEIVTVNSTGAIEFAACAHRDPDANGRLHQAPMHARVVWNSPDLAGQAMRSGETQFVADLDPVTTARLPVCSQVWEILREFHPQSAICVPLSVRGRAIGVITFVTNQASRPRYDERDVPVAVDLGHRVAVALENAQLFQSVRAADRQKDEFLAMLAHELRNPLAAISYAAQLAHLPGVDPKVELIDMIERQVDNLAHLIDDLLDISRISRGKIQLRRETGDAVQMVRRAAASLRPLFEEKRHTLTLELPEECLPIDADATRIEQIIGNLLTNAAKYTPEGGHIQVRAEADGDEVVIKVKDSGVGIAPEILPHVFELFTQAERSLDRSQGGLGIGLTVVQKLAELHGGTVAAYSKGVGEGSEFVVRLPLSRGITTPGDGSPFSSRDSGPRLRILVVEDNRDTAQAAARLLQSSGHEVEIAYNGPEAVEWALHHRPHVVLADIGLPGMNGYEVAAALRRQGLATTKLIAVSGYGQAEDQARSHNAGFDHHLIKPVDRDALFALLQSIESTSMPEV